MVNVTNDTIISDYAFRACEKITTITLPETRTLNEVETGFATIGKHSFENMTTLTAIIIPASTTTLDEYAFYGADIEKIVKKV